MPALHKLSDADLAHTLEEIHQEARRRTLAAVNGHDPATIIKGQEIGKRAATVAAAGGHSILFIGPPGQGKTMLRALLAALGHDESYEARPCPCGFRNDSTYFCTCTVAKIERHHAKLPQAEITVEVPRVPARELVTIRPGVGVAEMRAAIIDYMAHYDDLTLGDDCRILLKVANTELGFSSAQHESAIRVARTIANLDNSATIQPCHINEAIHYLMRRF